MGTVHWWNQPWRRRYWGHPWYLHDPAAVVVSLLTQLTCWSCPSCPCWPSAICREQLILNYAATNSANSVTTHANKLLSTVTFSTHPYLGINCVLFQLVRIMYTWIRWIIMLAFSFFRNIICKKIYFTLKNKFLYKQAASPPRCHDPIIFDTV